MSETKQTVTVGVANEGEINMNIDDLAKHEPKKISYIGSQVFFEHDGVFLSMDLKNFQEIFKK